MSQTSSQSTPPRRREICPSGAQSRVPTAAQAPRANQHIESASPPAAQAVGSAPGVGIGYQPPQRMASSYHELMANASHLAVRSPGLPPRPYEHPDYWRRLF